MQGWRTNASIQTMHSQILGNRSLAYNGVNTKDMRLHGVGSSKRELLVVRPTLQIGGPSWSQQLAERKLVELPHLLEELEAFGEVGLIAYKKQTAILHGLVA
jgi:hypothetical protein